MLLDAFHNNQPLQFLIQRKYFFCRLLNILISSKRKKMKKDSSTITFDKTKIFSTKIYNFSKNSN